MRIVGYKTLGGIEISVGQLVFLWKARKYMIVSLYLYYDSADLTTFPDNTSRTIMFS